ncbi:MAG: DUF4147 domain-containing protein [Candidatus Promineifilaceae bacterium]
MNVLSPTDVIQRMMRAALVAADPAVIVRNYLQSNPIVEKQVFVVAVGKAAVAMATASAEILPTNTQGIIISKLAPDSDPVQALPKHFKHFQAGHPVPDRRSVAATQAVKQLLSQTGEHDLVLCLISGGASALLTDPQISLAQWRELNQALLRCGCSINAINHVRQHLDAVKGGGLLSWAAPTQVKTLILSDVIGNNMSHIGSGPTVPTVKHVEKVWRIFEQFKVLGFVSAETKQALTKHLAELTAENTKNTTVENTIVGDIEKSVRAAAQVAEEMGFAVRVVWSTACPSANRSASWNLFCVWGGNNGYVFRANRWCWRSQSGACTCRSD